MNVNNTVNITDDIAPFTANGRAITETMFQALALNTEQNVVIEACAGSGKTWLLVARVLKLLLQGEAAQYIVAITFTRKAAQEMKQRLADMLDAVNSAAIGNIEGLALLQALGYSHDESSFSLAHTAWQTCCAQGDWPRIVTFHEWFGELRNNAPLSSLASAGAVLHDDELGLKTQAWQQFWSDTQDNISLQAAMQQAVSALGLAGFENAMDAMLARRAEWQVYASSVLQPVVSKINAAKNNNQNTTETASANNSFTNAVQLAHAAQAAFVTVLQPYSVSEILTQLAPLCEELRRLFKCYSISKTATAKSRAIAIERALNVCINLLQVEEVENLENLEKTGNHHQNQKNNANASILKLKQALSCAITPLSLADNSVVIKRKYFADMFPAVTSHYGNEVAFDTAFEALHTNLWRLQHQLSLIEMLPVHAVLLRCGAHLLAAYQTLKQSLGLMDFGDLELDALQLLGTQQAHSATPLLHLAQFGLVARHVLLDEFQDTNPVQWQALQAFLLPLLEESSAGGQAASVFVVGDPKQSIYRFRRADPRLFAHVKQVLHNKFDAVLLKTQRTRRNAVQVNAWVNAVFAPDFNTHETLFSAQFTLSEQAGRVGVLPLLKLDEAVDAAAAEAQQVVDTLLLWKARNPQLPWSQAMVLARKRQALTPIAQALRQRGIAYISAEKGGFFELPEITDVMALLAALANPNDALALLTALRSPIFSLDDVQLSALLQHSVTLKLTEKEEPAAWLGLAQLNIEWARNTAQWLLLWQGLCSRLPMHDALDAMLHQGEWVQRFAAVYPERAASVATHLAQLLQLSLSVDQGRYPSLQRFVQAVAELRISNATSAQSAIHTDAVRLSTVHGAKGLEADCVCMVDLYSRDSRDDRLSVLLEWPPEQAQPSLFVLQLCDEAVLATSPRLAHLITSRHQAQMTEYDTLLYVAMTRAVSELWVSAHAKKNTKAIYERLNVAYGMVAPVQTDEVEVNSINQDLDLTLTLTLTKTAEFDEIKAQPTQRLNQNHQNQLLTAPATLLPLTCYKPPLSSVKLNLQDNQQLISQATGVLLHRMLEHVLRHGVNPSVSAVATWAAPLGLTQTQAYHLTEQYQHMLQITQLTALIQSTKRNDSASYHVSHVALEEDIYVAATGRVLRPDVVVYYAKTNHHDTKDNTEERLQTNGLSAWVVDFKLSFDLEGEQADIYAAQLRSYVLALQAASLATVNAYLLTLAGECWQFDGLNVSVNSTVENIDSVLKPWQLCTVPWGQ